MSWLYTLVFTGLALASSGSGTAPDECPIQHAQTILSQMADEIEKFEQTYPLNANGRVNVSNVNGSVTVEAWDRNEVSLQYTKIADTKERLADVEVKVDSRADYFSVEADFGGLKKSNNGWKSGKLTVEMKLLVPRGAVLNEIETVNGSVALSNFTNFAKASTVNGSVKATNLKGTTRLSTVNGEVAADFERLDTGSKISLETVNGKVNLVIPSDSNATVKADSLNGNITNDFGLPVRKGKYVGRDLYGKLGNGDVQIKLNSVNGALAIGRKNDGKPLSPAVDLLTKKDADDENWDKEENYQLYALKAAKVNNEIAKALENSHKVAAKALAEAKVEIAKSQAVIPEINSESMVKAAEQLANAAAEIKSQNLQRKFENAQLAQLETLARIADIGFAVGFPRVEKKSDSFVVKGTPKVTVNAPGCSVKVRGWDKPEVQYRVTQFAEQRDRMPVKINEEHSDSAVTVNVENPGSRPGGFIGSGSRVNIEVFVPRKSNLKITANGELRVEGVSGEIELVGSDEPINVRDVEGSLRVTNSDGVIRVIGFRGEIDAQTLDGIINLEGNFSRLNARGSEGIVNLTLPEGTSADLSASKGNIKGEGIDLIRISPESERGRYRIGSGGPKFDIQTDGDIRVRGTSLLTVQSF